VRLHLMSHDRLIELALAVTAYSAATLAAFFIAFGLLPQLGY